MEKIGEKQVVPYNLKKEILDNKKYRKIIYTGHMQEILQVLKPNEIINTETHSTTDQWFHIKEGSIRIEETVVGDKVGMLVVELDAAGDYTYGKQDTHIVRSGHKHKVICTSESSAKFLTIYAGKYPLHHEDESHAKNPAYEYNIVDML